MIPRPTTPPTRALAADPGRHLVVAERRHLRRHPAAHRHPGLSRRGATSRSSRASASPSTERGSGLGTTLLEWAVEQSRRLGVTSCGSTSSATRTDAWFYERLGFVQSHVGFKLSLWPLGWREVRRCGLAPPRGATSCQPARRRRPVELNCGPRCRGCRPASAGPRRAAGSPRPRGPCPPDLRPAEEESLGTGEAVDVA